MNKVLKVLAIVALVVSAGCAGQISPATLQTDFADLGQGIGEAAKVAALVPAVGPYVTMINLSIEGLCAVSGATEPAAALASINTDVSNLWTALNAANTPVADAAVVVLNSAYSELTSAVGNAESSQALSDIQAFCTGLCTAYNGPASAKARIVIDTAETGKRVSWDAKASWKNFLYLFGVR